MIGVLAFVSLAGIFLVLMMLYPSVRITLQILNAIPTVFIGGVLALVITQQTLTVASLVGFVSLGGIAGRLAAVNQQIDLTRATLAALERERAGLRDQLGLRPDDGRDQPKLFEADSQPSLFGVGVAFDV